MIETTGIRGLKVIHAEPPKPTQQPSEVKKDTASKPKRTTKTKPTDSK